MRILTVTNEPYELDSIPNEMDDLRYCVLDCSDSKDIDFFYVPLVFLESFYSPAAVLRIGDFTVKMPLDWSILVCDEDYSVVEVVPLTRLNNRGFHSLTFNPFSHFVPQTYEVKITDVYADMKWFFPKLKNGNVLVVPLEDCKTPRCALFVKEYAKISETIDIAELLL